MECDKVIEFEDNEKKLNSMKEKLKDLGESL